MLVTLKGARIGAGVKPFVPTAGALLHGAETVQYSADTVHLVLQVASLDHVKIFSIPDPFRIVVDLRSVPLKTSSKKRFKEASNNQRTRLPSGALARQFALGVHKIVIDPGHGGRDFGAG